MTKPIYIYFWTPTTYDNANNIYKPNQPNPKEVELSDIKNNIKLFLSLNLSENLDLYVEIYGENGYRKNIYCEFQNAFSNGMFLYKISDKLNNIDKELLKIQVFHVFKSFYHTHIFHAANSDKILGEAYISTSPNKLQNAIEHYLKTYQQKFEAEREMLRKIPKNTIIKHFKETADIVSTMKKIEIIKSRLIRIRGELIFANYLARNYYRSYNKINYIDLFRKEEKFFELITYDIDRLTEKIQVIYSTIINNKQTFLAILLFILSIVITILLH